MAVSAPAQNIWYPNFNSQATAADICVLPSALEISTSLNYISLLSRLDHLVGQLTNLRCTVPQFLFHSRLLAGQHCREDCNEDKKDIGTADKVVFPSD